MRVEKLDPKQKIVCIRTKDGYFNVGDKIPNTGREIVAINICTMPIEFDSGFQRGPQVWPLPLIVTAWSSDHTETQHLKRKLKRKVAMREEVMSESISLRKQFEESYCLAHKAFNLKTDSIPEYAYTSWLEAEETPKFNGEAIYMTWPFESVSLEWSQEFKDA